MDNNRTQTNCVCVCARVRWTYQEFFSRYRVLMKQKDVLPDKKLTCKHVLERLVEVRMILNLLFLINVKLIISNDSAGYFVWKHVCFSLTSGLCLLPRTTTNISLVRAKSSSGLARWLTWRSWEQTSCALRAFASRKRSAAGWLARSICANAALPSPSRGLPEVTRPAGEWPINWVSYVHNIFIL